MSGRFFGGSFQWKAWAHLQKIFDWTDRALRNDQKSWIFLVAFLYFYFRIIPSKIANHEVFLPIEELSVARFCKSRALSTRKYMVEQGIRVSHWSEIFKSIWLHSIFGLGQSKPSVSDKFGMVILFWATYVLHVSAEASFKAATKGSFRGKKPEKFAFLNLFSWSRNGGVLPK